MSFKILGPNIVIIIIREIRLYTSASMLQWLFLYCSSERRTLLSYAAEVGNVEVVCFLFAGRSITEDGTLEALSPEGSGRNEV